MKRPKTKSLVVYGTIAAILLMFWISWAGGIVPQVWQVNALLQDDPMLQEYPYKFRAVLLASGVATMTRPYDMEVAPFDFLQVIEPDLAGKAPNDPAMVAALKRLRAHERRAARVAVSHTAADGVEWVLDRAWYHKHGIKLPPKTLVY
ncbi:hypothetical protein Thimo_1600 [Thioflavicoccus mobilis 8321]|uniref:Uncharacterized protein n=1 Tax=Thioflavicoccus mobilis 8321 TaxID=765912 RepID=L0GYI8_9GAMM|nr:hypothetical protein [Thioflavicoccus mobilis]AGA90379.1 hypothetical protein Thimo_1600 [Thioflavicoccus mobilis 8321]